MKNHQVWGRIMVLVCALSLCNFSYAEDASNAVEEDPSAVAMSLDLIVVRPITFVMTIGGAALWLVSLPFSAAGGNAKQAGQTLVVGPAMTTFVRCLGCTKNGYNR